MSTAEIAETLAGLALVAVVLADVFRSLVVPRPSARTLRLGPWIAIGAMRGALRLTRQRRRPQRHELLGALGPALLVAELLIWVAVLILGFGLLLDGLRSDFKQVDSLADAAYIAASAMFTLGLPSGFEATGPARIVVAIAALSGLGVVTLTVTFLLAIQGALTERGKLVLRLRARTGPHPSGLVILLAHARLGEEHPPTLVEFFGGWEEWSAAVLLTHRAFPILCYFRSTDPDCEWLAADLARQFKLRPDWSPELDEAAFRAAAARLREAGFGVRAAPDASWQRFSTLRAAYAPPLAALCDRFGVEPASWDAR